MSQTSNTNPPSCPKCGSIMVIRTKNKEPNKGKQFWGCSNFGTQKCRGMMDMTQIAQHRKQPNGGYKTRRTARPSAQDKPPNEPDDAGYWNSDKRVELLNNIHDRDGGLCGICGRRVSIEGAQVEHIVPKVFGYFNIQKGGKVKIGTQYKSLLHETDNLQLAHPQCNKHKGNKVDTRQWRHPIMPSLKVAVTEDGREFVLPYKGAR